MTDRHTRWLALLLATALALFPAASRAATPTGPLSVPPQAQAELDKQLAATYATILPEVEQKLQDTVAKLSGTTHGKLTIDSLAITKLDLASPPRFVVTPLATGQHHFLFFHWGTARYDGEQIRVELPAGGSSWAVELQGHLEYDVDVKLLFHIRKHISEDVTLGVSNLHASEEVELDTTDPTLPVCKKTGDVQLDYDLHVKTGSTWLNVLLTLAKPVIDHVLRSHVDDLLKKLDVQLAQAQGLPNAATIWGLGAPARPAFGAQPDLEAFALRCSDDIQKIHTPWKTVLEADLSDPTYGQGSVTGYGGFGDSAIWTGHYLAGESFRYAVTKDPQALANAQRAIEGITDLLDVETPGDGHLARCLVPLSDPNAQPLVNDPSAFTATLRGQPYVALDHISRDQYLGVMHGLGCAHDFIDDPATKDQAAALIQRIVDYLVKNGWNAMEHDGVTVSADFIQSPEKMISFSKLAAETDARYQPLADELADLAYFQWAFGWTGTLDPLSSYYKWNLGYGANYHAMRLETDPNRFAALERAHAIDRRVIGHHENAYFQTIDAALDPTLASTLAPEVMDELRRFTAYGRRARTVTNSQDPTIEQATYSVPLSYQKSGSTGGLVPKTEVVAKYPIPVEKRVSTDFLWQRSPFDLDGQADPRHEAPGVDAVLPYWIARYYQLVP